MKKILISINIIKIKQREAGAVRAAGGGGGLFYVRYIGMCHSKGYVQFSSCISLKMGTDFNHYGLRSESIPASMDL